MSNISAPVTVGTLRERGNIPKADFILVPVLKNLEALGYVKSSAGKWKLVAGDDLVAGNNNRKPRGAGYGVKSTRSIIVSAIKNNPDVTNERLAIITGTCVKNVWYHINRLRKEASVAVDVNPEIRNHTQRLARVGDYKLKLLTLERLAGLLGDFMGDDLRVLLMSISSDLEYQENQAKGGATINCAE
jgi:hypothetical protein